MFDTIRFIIATLIRVYDLILLAYCLCSWIIRNPYNRFYAFLSMICDPVLNPIRALLQHIPFLQRVPIDLSPLLLMYLLHFIVRFI